MNKLPSTILVVFLSLAAFAQAPKSVSPLEETLMANTKAIPEAQKSKNVGFLKSALTNDFRFVGSEGRMHGREEFIGDAGDGALKDYTVYNLRVMPVDDNTALVSYDGIIHMPEGDNDMAPRYQYFSDLWVKQGDQWKLRFQQATPRRPID